MPVGLRFFRIPIFVDEDDERGRLESVVRVSIRPSGPAIVFLADLLLCLLVSGS